MKTQQIELILQTSTSLANYIFWRWSNHITAYPVHQKPKYYNKFLSTWKFAHFLSIERWKICVDKVNDALGMALSAEYIKRNFDDETLKKIAIMIDHWKLAFKSQIDEVTWMDSDTKVTAKEKVDAMKQFVGYPSWMLNKTMLENYYSGVGFKLNF